MRCPKCGQDNPTGKIVCTRCGARLRPGSGPAAIADNPERFMVWLRGDLVRLGVVVVLVVAIVFALGTFLR